MSPIIFCSTFLTLGVDVDVWEKIWCDLCSGSLVLEGVEGVGEVGLGVVEGAWGDGSGGVSIFVEGGVVEWLVESSVLIERKEGK